MKRKTRSIDFTTGNIWRLLLMYFLPILASSMFQQLYSTVDAVIVGQFAGKTGLAAIDSVYNLLKLPVNFLVGLSTGATIIISQYFGGKKDELLSKAVHTAVCFAVAGGLVLSVAGIVAAPWCMQILEVPDSLRKFALEYVRIYFGGLAVSMLYNICAGILRAVGDSKTPFYALLISGAINVVLDLIFVGELRMNAAGAALATVLAQLLSAGIVLHRLIRADESCQLHFSRLKADFIALKDIVRLGIPVGLQSSLYPIANMTIQSSINSTGTDNIAAWALCGKLDFMIWLIVDSLAAATSTFVAQNYGAKQYVRARAGVRVSVVMTAMLISGISAVLYFGSEPIGRLFIHKEDAGIAALTGELMRFLAPFYVMYVFGAVYSNAIRGTGESFKPMLITLLCTCAVRVLWILLVVPSNHSIKVILGCYPVSWITSAVVFFTYYQIVAKKRQ